MTTETIKTINTLKEMSSSFKLKRYTLILKLQTEFKLRLKNFINSTKILLFIYL